jgi:hypothetical protein
MTKRRNKKSQPPGLLMGDHITKKNKCEKVKVRVDDGRGYVPSHRQIAGLISKSLHPAIQKPFVECVSSIATAASQERRERCKHAMQTPSPATDLLISKTPIKVIEQAYLQASEAITPTEDRTTSGRRLVIEDCSPVHMMKHPLGAYVASITVNRKSRRMEHNSRASNESIFGESVVVPTCDRPAQVEDEFDYAFQTFIVVLPSASVFYSMRFAGANSSDHRLLPIPTSWLRLVRSTGQPARDGFAKHIHCVWSVHTSPIIKNDERSIAVWPAYHFDDEHQDSPLLAPDVFHDQNGMGEPPRKRYREALAVSNSNRAQCRRYVNGALHQQLPPTCYILDIKKKGDVALQLLLHDKEGRPESESVVQVRSASHHRSFLSLAREAGSSLVYHGVKGNCRLRTEDKGGMYAIGEMMNTSQEMRTTNVVGQAPALKYILPRLCKASSVLAQDLFPHVLSAIVGTEELAGLSPPAVMGGAQGPSGLLNASIDLGNATHYDVGDESYGYSVWTETKGDAASNWYFVLPSVLLRRDGVTYQGVAIKLFHGIAIAWDGRVVRHGTSITTCAGTGNHTFGWFWAANGRKVSHLLPHLDDQQPSPPIPIPTCPNDSAGSSRDTPLPPIPRRNLPPTSSSLIDTSS